MYHPILRWLHSLMAGLLLVMIPLGLILPHLEEGPWAGFLYEIHKSIGILLFGLILIRVVARLRLSSPHNPTAISAVWYRFIKLAHFALYGLMIAIPLLGYGATSICCAPIVWMGVYEIPLTIDASEDTAKLLFSWHAGLAWALALIVVGHILAALWHRHRQDGIFQRMWPSQGASSSGEGG